MSGTFIRIDGKLFWQGNDGKLIGPLNASTPTCADGAVPSGTHW